MMAQRQGTGSGSDRAVVLVEAPAPTSARTSEADPRLSENDASRERIKAAVAILARFYLEPPEPRVPERAFAGSLSELSLPDVLQVLNALRKTGALTLSEGMHSATIVLKDGQIVGCLRPTPGPAASEGAARRALQRSVVDTILDVLHWGHGRFVFEGDDSNIAAKLRLDANTSPSREGLSTTEILLNVFQRVDEQRAHLRASYGDVTPVAGMRAAPVERSGEIALSESVTRWPQYRALGATLTTWVRRRASLTRRAVLAASPRQRRAAAGVGAAVLLLIGILTAAMLPERGTPQRSGARAMVPEAAAPATTRPAAARKESSAAPAAAARSKTKSKPSRSAKSTVAERLRALSQESK